MFKIFFNLFNWSRKKYWKFFNIETFGVRTLIFKDNKVLLVKHRYGNFWVMPGGGIEKNENLEDAAKRELKEEAGIIARKIDYKLRYYKNTRGGKNDNVHCFVVTDFEDIPNFKRNFIDFLEISEVIWADINNLPNDISAPTKARIAEFLMDRRDLVSTW
jgi:8-oxo-dGTP pyrophosphatase MutT (NUDIX family)